MTTARHGAPKTVNASNVMTVTGMPGKMATQSMESVHITTGLKMEWTMRPLILAHQILSRDMMLTVNVSMTYITVLSATRRINLTTKDTAFPWQPLIAKTLLTAFVLNVTKASTLTSNLIVSNFQQIAQKLMIWEIALNVLPPSSCWNQANV